MKTTPANHTIPNTGAGYWRSLDELSGSPGFNKWVDREFPEGASEFTDPKGRRQFVKIMSASFMMAGLGMTGCRRPEEQILPFAKQPDGYVHGVAEWFASARPTRNSATPLLVKSSDGRPTKLEGNGEHPDSKGTTDTFTQASILDLYDPDRATEFLNAGHKVSRVDALDTLKTITDGFSANKGGGVAVLAGQGNSPTRLRLKNAFLKKYPRAKWHTYEPIDLSVDAAAYSTAFSKSVKPYYRYQNADVVVSLDADFLGTEEDSSLHAGQFAEKRTPKEDAAHPEMNRLYSIESLFTVTGAAADHRLRVKPSAVKQIAAQLAKKVLAHADLSTSLQGEILPALLKIDSTINIDASWIDACAEDLRNHAGRCLIVAGHRQPEEVHLMAIAMNQVLGNLGHTVLLHDQPVSNDGDIAGLVDALNHDKVESLVIMGSNPSYDAPADLDWKSAVAKAKNVVRLSGDVDESTPTGAGNLQIPEAHYLESWGDAHTADGTLVPVQPLISPLFGGVSDIEFLARIGGLAMVNSHELVRETFFATQKGGEEGWKKFLHDGFAAGTASKPGYAKINWIAISDSITKTSLENTEAGFEIVFARDYSADDGRFNNNGWLQETPDPISKLTWDNAMLVSPQTAKGLGLTNLDQSDDGSYNNPKRGMFFPQILTVMVNGKTVTGPAWVIPGMADETIGFPLGYGRKVTGRVGENSGFNAFAARNSDSLGFATGAKVSTNGEQLQLAATQEHGVMEGRSSRPHVREFTLDQFTRDKNIVNDLNLEHPPIFDSLYPNPLDEKKKTATHQWGMVIDLNTCTGCNVCVLACQSENNIPIVGKEQVIRGREMSWIRLDRYYVGGIDNPQVAIQPIACMHCEAAPCESVCPVNATVHDDEGLNLMIYNRCVGTRYCSNNCPYKVRRFNFFDYNRRNLDELYQSPIVKQTEGEWELARWFKDPTRGSKPQDEWDLLKLVKNPDVSVRMRGVMEKCTYCIQRIEQNKIATKVAARDTDDVSVPDGAIKTACQQACPSGSIVFGNLNDPESAVSKAKKSQRDYSVLEHLYTRPRTTYLTRLRNPNPKMPDAYDVTETYKAWKKDQHHGDHADHAPHSEAEAAHHGENGKGDHH
ncbi:TAT-variant-translocated molybdopterin oxidoreductase [Verrucomicrobia bacterium]|nr:TAT-variant-translocated molybdopterin oxidoreductase [Verrucomicrobiota bacterium]